MDHSPRSFEFRPFRPIWLTCAAVISLTAPKPSAEAATLYWDSNGATAGAGVTPTGTWGSSTFWTTDLAGLTVTTGYTAGSDAVFSAGTDATGSPTITVSGAQTAASLTIQEGATLTFAGTATPSLALGTGGLNMSGTVAATFGSTLSITLSGVQAWTNNSSGLLTVSGTVGQGTNALTITGAGATTIGGIISGSGGIVKTGAGTLTLSGANTYTGLTTVTTGILRATTSAQALGTGAATLSLGGGTLQLANDTALSFNRNTTVTANSTITADRLTSATTSITHTLGTLSIGAQSLTITRGANITGAGVGGITFGNTTISGASSAANFSPGANTTLTLGTVTGTTPTITMSGAGTLVLNGSFSTATALTINSGGTVTLNTNNSTSSAALTVNGTLNFNNGQIFGVLNGSGTINENTNWLYTNTSLSTGSYSGTINGTGGYLKQGTGTQTLSGLSSYDGSGLGSALTTHIQNGALSINTIKNVGGGTSALGAPTTATTGRIGIGNTTTTGTLIYTGAVTSTDRQIQIGFNSPTPAVSDTGGATIQNDGAGTLTFSVANFNTSTNAATGTSPTRTLTLQGSNNGVISGIIQNNQIAAAPTAAVALTKSGSGTWTLDGVNTYTGATAINQGTLLFNAINTGLSGVTVSGTATNNATLGGTGTVPGTVSLAIGTAFTGAAINPGTVGGAGTLTLSNATGFTAAGFTRLNFDLNTAQTVGGGVNDLIASTGLPSLTAGSSGTQVNLNALSPLTLGAYTLINGYTGTITNTPVAGNLTGDATKSILGLLNNANSLQVVIGSTPPTAAFWSGGLNGDWNGFDASANTNWRVSATGADTNALPASTTNVTFGTTTPAATNLTTTLGQAFSINSLTFASSISTPTSIAGPSALTVGASGIANSSSVGGAVTISAPVTMGAAQSWTNNNTTDAMVVSGSITGSGLLTKAGAGALTLSGTNTGLTGGVTLSAGTLNINSASALGTVAGTFTISGASTIDNTTAGAITLTANNPVALNSNFTYGGTRDLNLGTGAVTMNASRSIAANGTGTLTLGGTVALGANTLTKTGSGGLSLGGVISGSTAVGSTAMSISNGVLTAGNAANTFTGNIAVSGTGVFAMVGNTYTTAAPYGTVAGGTAYKQLLLTNGGTFRLVSGSFNNNAVSATNLAGGIIFNIGTGGGTLDVASSLTIDDGSGAGTATTNSQLQGSGTLTKTGLGTLSLGNGSSNFGAFSGAIIVNAGILTTGSVSTTPLGTIAAGTTINSGAALNANGVSWTAAEPLTINGTGLASSPQGALTNNSATAATWVGPVTLGSAATIGHNSTGGFILSSTATINTAGFALTMANNGSGNYIVNGIISGSGSVTLIGSAGQYVPGGASTYSGDTSFGASTNTIPQLNSTGNPGSVTSGPFGTGTLTFVPTAQIRAKVGTVTTINNNVILNGGITFQTAATEANFIFGGPVTLTGSDAAITSAVGTTVPGTGAILSGVISDSGNNLGLTKAGAGNLTLSGANTYTGTTTVNAGTLILTGSLANNTALSVVPTVGTGATFTLASGAANPLSSISTLTLGSATGTTSIGLDLGTGSDALTTANAAVANNAIAFNLSSISGFSAGTYNLISAASGLTSTGATYSLNNVPGGYTFGLSATDSLVQLNATAAAPGTLYWRGNANNGWSSYNAGNTNWFTDSAGTTNAAATPGFQHSVVFSTTNATGPVLSATLDNDVSIKDLQFNSDPTGVTAVNVAPGLAPGGSLGSLTLTPAASSTGITVAANAGNVTISAPVILGAPQTWTADGTGANGSTLTVSGGIIGAVSNPLTIGGLVTLSAAAGTSTYSGSTTVPNGAILQGGATNSFSANSAMTVNGTGILRLNGFSNTIASLSGDGTVQNNHASTGATLTFGAATNTTFSGILQNGGGAALGLTKNGNGSLTLSGTNTHTGNTLVTNGILNIPGTGSITGNTTATKLLLQPTIAGNSSILNYSSSATSTFFAVNGASLAGTASVLNQSAGLIQISPNTTTDTQSVVTATGAYGAYNISGGTFRNSTGTAGGSRFTLTNIGTASATNGTITGVRVGMLNVSGTGFVDHTNAEWWLSYSLGQINVTDTGKIDHTGSSQPFGLVLNTTVVGGGYGVLNVAGTGAQVITGAQPLRVGNSITAGQGDGLSAFVNLAAGTLSTGTIGTTSLPATPTATNYWYYNYAGGTLKATGTLAAGWSPASGASATVINTIFGAIDNSAVAGAPSFTGGLTVDTNGNPVTIPSTQPLLAAGGVGVTQANLSVSGGSGYIGTPAITFSKPAAANGVAAAGYAIITGGAVTGIVITDPGVYAANETPTITLLGGFASGAGTAATVTSSSLTTNNTSGGLTKIGLGTLTLSGAGNTYSAGTTVSEGTLALGVNNGLPTGRNLTVNSTGTFDVSTFTNTVGTVSLQGSGVLTGSTGVITSNADYDLRSGTVNFTGSGGLAGAVNVTKSTAGTVTLTNNGLGSFPNAINVTGGTLAFSAPSQLGNASATNILGLNGGTLSYTAATTSSLAATQVLTLGSGGGTLNASDASGVLNLLGGVTTSTAANLTKNGLGTIAITGSTNLTGGNVTVSAGVLNAGFTPTGLGGISVASGASLNLYDGATTTMAINGLTLSSGSSLGFDLNAPGVNDILNLTGTASITPTISLNFNSLGGLAAGTYDLLNVTGGSLVGGDYTLGSAPSGFNYVFSTINGDQTLRLTTTPLNLVYWHGDIAGGSWSTLNAGPDTNFSNVLSGATDLGTLPVATDTLVFSTAAATGPAIATTLDGNFTVDSLRFTANPTGLTSVSIEQGTGGTLTIAPVGSNNGISVAANAGIITIGAPLTTGSPQTWETANSAALNVSGVVTYTSGVTKTGNGVLTLSGNNTGTGGLNLAEGTLNLAHNSALGTGIFTVGAGTTIDASVGAIVNAGNNPQIWNGSFTFTGTNALDFGNGVVALNNNATITTTASTLTVGGAIGDGGNNRSLTKAGASTLTLSGVNTYSGGTTLNAGTLNLGNAAALGSGTLTIAGGNLDNSTGSALTLSTNNAQAWNSNLAFIGTNDLNLGIGAVVLSTTPTVTVTANTLTVGGNISGAGFGLAKAGAGTLILAGTNSYTGATTVSAGILRLSGSAGSTALTVNGGSLQFGSATALTSANSVTLASAGTLDLFGNSQTIGSLTNASTNLITNTGSGTGTNTLTISAANPSLVTLISDGSSAKTALRVNNTNAATQITTNTSNTYSGGLILANNTSGTRLAVGTILGTPWGSGPIIIGDGPADKAGIYFNTGSQTMTNPIVFNTGLGTDRFGIRADVAGTTLSGQITANSDAVFSSNLTTGALLLTNKVSGAGGLVLDLSQTSTANSVLTVTLNSAANANDYQGDTVVGRTNAAPSQNYTATLTLAAANQIPNGSGKGNVILNNNTASRTGNLNLAGFSETINGLSGNGTVDGTSGTPTFTLGDNNATETFSGIIKNTAGNLALTKIGTGTQTLSSANTFSGVTTNSEGTLSLGNNLALQNSPLDTLNSIAGDATNGLKTTVTSLTLGGLTGNKDFASVFTTTAGGYNTVTALTMNPGTGLSPAYTGAITDGATGMSINKSGAGTQILNGGLSHTGGISVAVGTLTLGSSSNSYAGNTTISSGAGLIVTADGALGATGTGNATTVAGALGLAGGITYSTVEKIVGSGAGNATAPAGFAAASRGFIQSVSGNNTFAGDVELSANGTSRIGTQTGAQLTLTGAITQGSGVTTADVLFRAGDNAGDFVTLSNTGNSFGGNSTVFTGATVGNYAGVRLGVSNGLPNNLTISGFSSTGAGAALDLNGKNQTLNGLITGGGAMSIVNIDTVNDSTLTLNPTADKSSNNTLVLGGGGLGVISLVKDGAFTQTLSGANTYTGTTTISAGSLSINSIANVGAASSAIGAPTTVANGLIAMGRAATTGTLIYTGGAQSTDRTIQIGTNSPTPAITDTGGATIEANGASNAALTFSTTNFNTQTIAATGVGADRVLTLQGASTGANTISGIIQNNLVSGVGTGTASVSVNKAGAGTWILAGDNTYSGGTTLTAGILQANHNNAFGTGAVTVNGTRLIVNAGVTVPNAINIGVNTGASGLGLIQPVGTGVGTLSGAINITSGTPAGGLFAGTSTADLHLSGVITSSVQITQRLNTVIYSGGGTGYTGLLVTGTARVGATNGIATTATVNLGGSAAGNLDLNGLNQSLAGITKASTFAAIVGNSSTTTDSVLTTTGTSSYAGIIQNTLGSGTKTVALTVASGSLTLTGANTYTGKTTIGAGTLALSGTGSLADTGAVELISNTSVFNIAGITPAVSEKIATLSGVSDSIVTLGGKTLELGDGTAAFAGDIDGSGGSVTKSGTGVQRLSGNNTYTGSTNISGGTLLLGSDTALPSGAGLSLSGGTLQTGSFGATTGALSVTAVSIIDMNETASVLTFANTGTWTGLLKVWNYSGGAVWTGSTGDKLLFDAGSAPASNLVQFYSDGGITPVGVGGGFITSGLGSELVPVPEASTVFGALALLGLVGYRERRRR